MMKPNLLLVSLFCALFTSAQQSAVTLHAYKQQSSGGAQRIGTVDENGAMIKQKSRQLFQYAIYTAIKSESDIHFKKLWIEGKPCSITTETINNLPVRQISSIPQGTERLLVPKTSSIVLKIIPVCPNTSQSSKEAILLARQNAVVVLYEQKGKRHYGVLKKFTELEPLLLK